MIPSDGGCVTEASASTWSGSIKRRTTGIIGTNKKDAQETVTTLLEHAATGRLDGDRAGRREEREAWVAGRQPDLVTHDDWLAIDRHERELGEPHERPRVKLTRIEELVRAGRGKIGDAMETLEAMRTTGTCREFKPDPVPDELLMRAFEAARFAPQGGNRQPVRWIVVRDAGDQAPAARPVPADLEALPGARDRRRGSTSGALPATVRRVDDFAENLHEVPAIVVVCFEPESLLATDDELAG